MNMAISSSHQLPLDELLVAKRGRARPFFRLAALSLSLLLLLEGVVHHAAGGAAPEPAHPTFHNALALGASNCPKFEHYTLLHRAALNGQGVPPGYYWDPSQHPRRHIPGGKPMRKLRGSDRQRQLRDQQGAPDERAVEVRGQSRRRLRGALLETAASGSKAGLIGVATSHAPRWVVTEDPDGLADRLVNAVSAFYFALLTNRALCIRPAKDYSSQPGLEAAFASPHIDWTCRSAPNPLPGVQEWDATDSDDWLYPETQLYKTFVLSDLNTVGPADAATIALRIHRGLSVALFQSPHHARQMQALGLRPDTAFGCAAYYLFSPGPLMWALAQQDPALHAAMVDEGRIKIGIQIRLGDDSIVQQLEGGSGAVQLTEAALQHVGGFFRCAEELEADIGLHMGWGNGTGSSTDGHAAAEAGLQLGTGTSAGSSNSSSDGLDGRGAVGSGALFYIMTDTLAVRQWAVERYGPAKVVFMQGAVVQYYRNVSVHGFAATALEHWYFSRSHHHVITSYSGMGRTASFMSLRPGPPLYSMDVDGGMRTDGRGCGLADPDRPLEVYNVWSGI